MTFQTFSFLRNFKIKFIFRNVSVLSYHGHVCHREHVQHVELAQVEVVGAELRGGEQGEGGHQVHLHISSALKLSSLHIRYAKSSQCWCAMCYQLESIQQEEEIVESFPDLGLAEHHVETHVACRGQEVIRSQLSDTGHKYCTQATL